MSAFTQSRLVIFTFISIFSLITVILLGHLTSITTSVGFYYSSFALAIATGVLSILVIATSVLVDNFRRGALVALIGFELAWTSVLWILWLASAASITSLDVFSSCNYVNASVQATCREYLAALAFTWMLWLLTFGWFSYLLIISVTVVARGAGSNVWQTPVTEHPYFVSNKQQTYRSPMTTYPTSPGWTQSGYAMGEDTVVSSPYVRPS